MIGTFLLFAVATIGLTHIIVDSTLFEPIRSKLKDVLHSKVYKVFECYQCAGTWCGFITGLALVSKDISTILMCGFAGSFLAMWGARYLDYLEAKSYLLIDDDDKQE